MSRPICWSQNLPKLIMYHQRSFPNVKTKNKPLLLAFSKIHRTQSFHVAVLYSTENKCTKMHNARAQLLFCLLHLLFDGVLVAVVVCLNLCYWFHVHSCTSFLLKTQPYINKHALPLSFSESSSLSLVSGRGMFQGDYSNRSKTCSRVGE